MKIGINATCINDRPSGARQRFIGLTGSLARLMPESEFVVFEPKDCRMAGWFSRMPNISTRTTPLSSTRRVQRFLRGLLYWPQALAEENFDLFEALHMPATRSSVGKTLLTIHDVRGLHSDAGWVRRQVFGHVLRRSLARADRVVTVSHAMSLEILAFSATTPVTVIYNGLDIERFVQVDPVWQEQAASRLQLPEQYLLAVGHFEPRKNYAKLVAALAILHRAGTAFSLVIVGNDSGERKRIEALAASAGLASSVQLLSGLPDDDLRCVYRNASLLVFPSKYEGFGIPLLEAMASGLPVTASSIPVFREILGDAGVYFDPGSAEQMAAAIKSVITSKETRERLVARGAERVRDFDFKVLARETSRLYESMIGSK